VKNNWLAADRKRAGGHDTQAKPCLETKKIAGKKAHRVERKNLISYWRGLYGPKGVKNEGKVRKRRKGVSPES